MIFIDAHVHLHGCYNASEFFDNAYRNLKHYYEKTGSFSEFIGVLFLAESAGVNCFNKFVKIADLKNSKYASDTFGLWVFERTNEKNSIIVSSGERKLILIAGHQVAAAEDLELLMLGTTCKVPDGLSIFDLLEKAKQLSALRVIPWGAGKWLFSRGKLLKKIIDLVEADNFFLGDEGGRPIFWPIPRHFHYAARKEIRNLPGTDPLPFPGEVSRAGSFGCWFKASMDWTRPAASILSAICNPEIKLNCFGNLEKPFRFFYNQLRMQKRKRIKYHMDSAN